MRQIPLLVVAFIMCNIGLVGIVGKPDLKGDPWKETLMTVPLPSSGHWEISLGSMVVFVALGLLLIEIIRPASSAKASIAEHLLSGALFAALLIEFLLVPSAADSSFFIVMAISLIDVVSGLLASRRSGRRDSPERAV